MTLDHETIRSILLKEIEYFEKYPLEEEGKEYWDTFIYRKGQINGLRQALATINIHSVWKELTDE